MRSNTKKKKALNQSVVPDMKYWMFKREWNDDKLLEEFIRSHLLEFNEYNISVIRDFAEKSIESPIDFKNVINKLQKRARQLKKEENKQFKRMNSMCNNSKNYNSKTISKER